MSPSNEELLIEYLKKDREQLANRTIAAEGCNDGYKRRIKEISSKVDSIITCGDETDMRKELDELVEMIEVYAE